jgi:putative oxygen-independent coproporphyrinogen III oxidase
VRGPRPFGVYVHVPFCRHRCDYCAFATWTGKDDLWEEYVAACMSEINRLGRVPGLALGGARAPASDLRRGPATSVFFGGGTPSLLPAELLLGMLEALSGSIGLAAGAEVTVECNPETVTAEKLGSYRAGGVTRLSFGIQSMVPHVLAALGREHEPSSVMRAASLAGEAGFAGAYNADLIFGAAGESMGDWEASLEGVLALDPPPAHVSAYALTVEPGTPLATQRERHPSEDDQADKYAVACSWLGSAGFDWYEISNWARPGARCAHNLLYWSQGEYLGFGCSAHSHLTLPDGTARRWWNVRTPERYCRLVEAGEPVEAAGETLDAEQRRWEALALSLRTSRGVPASTVPDELIDDGLVEVHAGENGGAEKGSGEMEYATGGAGELGGDRAVLTPRGRLLANEVTVRLRL